MGKIIQNYVQNYTLCFKIKLQAFYDHHIYDILSTRSHPLVPAFSEEKLLAHASRLQEVGEAVEAGSLQGLQKAHPLLFTPSLSLARGHYA